MANKFYVVLQGYKPGIYDNWSQCEEQIKGYKSSKFKSFKTYPEALQAFHKQTFDEFQQPTAPTSITKDSISVDVGTHGNPGIMEYRLVETDSGREIYHSRQYPVGTNNLGEFLAIVHAIGYVRQQGLDVDIYSDSRTGLAWVRDKQYKTSLKRNKDTELLFNHLDRAVHYLKAHEPYKKLFKWNTHVHGEIKADFGRKR